jgi:hypothetical protein
MYIDIRTLVNQGKQTQRNCYATPEVQLSCVPALKSFPPKLKARRFQLTSNATQELAAEAAEVRERNKRDATANERGI